jgi:hypothetical protein
MKWIYVDAASSDVSLHGTWRATGKAGALMDWAANTASVICERSTAQCEEVIAVIRPPDNFVPRPSLDIVRLTYSVLEWTDEVVRAHYAAPAGDFEIRIAIVDKSAERSFRETKSRGSTTSDPSIVRNWVLGD